ncbi:MAG: histidine kinase dimerization/phosphoacceptor domain -containing protein [Bacteroidota bacterium]
MVLICVCRPDLQAKKDLDSLQALVRDLGQPVEERMEALFWYSFYNRYTDLELAYEMADSLERMAIRHDNLRYQHEAQLTKSFWHKKHLRYDSALHHCRLALELAIESKEKRAEAHAWCESGTIQEDLGEMGNATRSYHKCYETGRDGEAPTPTARGLVNLGYAYRITGDYVSAMDYLQRARKLCIKHHFTGYYPSISQNLGDIYQAQGDLEAAWRNYLRGYQESIKVNNQLRATALALRVAEVKTATQEYDSALHYLSIARQTALKMGLAGEMIAVEMQLGNVYLFQEQYGKAKQHAEASYSLQQENMDSLYLAEILYLRGRIALVTGKPAAAARLCEAGRGVAAVRDNIVPLANNCDCLWQALKAKGDARGALDTHREYIQWRDSLVNQKKTRQLAIREAEIRFGGEALADSLAYAQELELQSMRYETERKSQRRRLYLAVAGVGIAIVLLALLLVLFLTIRKNNRLLTRSNQEIAEKAETIEQALRDKEVLIREVHHRVKNNLQIIAGLLDLQMQQADDEAARKVLLEGQSRINAMGLIHSMLYRKDDVANVEMQKYIHGLCGEVQQLFPEGHHVKMQVGIEPLFFEIDHAVPLGLILNELLTNAFKYAVPRVQHPAITVQLHHQLDRHFLVVADNGPGTASDHKPESGLGMQLVYGLVRQLKGEVEVDNTAGARVTVSF